MSPVETDCIRGIGIGILLSKSVNFDDCNESIAWAYAYMHCLGFVGTMTFTTPVTNACQLEHIRQT